MRQLTQSNKKPTVAGSIALLLLAFWMVSPILLGVYVIKLKADLKAEREKAITLYEIVNRFTDGLRIAPEPAPTVPTPTPTPSLINQNKEIKPKATSSTEWTGKVSHYSRSGCLGCSATLTMANGQELKDEGLTIAFNHAKLNSKVKLTNLDNGKSVIATVTDRGGFEKYNRIADLTLAVAGALETKTDVSTVKIELVD